MQLKKDAEAEDSQHELHSLFQMGLSLLIHPVILLRLLMHRLTSSLALLKKGRSGQLPSSRNNLSEFHGHSSSIETTSTRGSLSKRRKINLTVDCSSMKVESSGPAAFPSSPTAIVKAKVQRRSSVKISYPDSHVVIRENGLSNLAPNGYSERHIHSASVEFSSINTVRASPSKQDMSDSGNSSKGDTPITSPSFFSKRTFRFSSLVKKRSKSHVNISSKASNLSDFSPPQQHQHNLPRSAACEVDIMAFQRELQNLPQFDSCQPLTWMPVDVPSKLPPERTRIGRPRSRSVPKVILESSFLLAPPPPLIWGVHRGPIATSGNGTSFVASGKSSSSALQKPLNDTTGHTPPSQRSTPSVSPVPLHGGTSEMTVAQSAVLQFVEVKVLCVFFLFFPFKVTSINHL